LPYWQGSARVRRDRPLKTLFQIIRFPVYVLGAIGLVLFLPIHLVVAVLTLVLRILYVPVALVGAALHNNEAAFRRYMSTTRDFPWLTEYAVMWRDLNKWLRDGPR
jgi:hypothetical protein